MKEKLLPAESDDDEEAEEEVKPQCPTLNQPRDSYNRVRLERFNGYF